MDDDEVYITPNRRQRHNPGPYRRDSVDVRERNAAWAGCASVLVVVCVWLLFVAWS